MLMDLLLDCCLAGASPDLEPGQRRLAKSPIGWTVVFRFDVLRLLAIVGCYHSALGELEGSRRQLGSCAPRDSPFHGKRSLEGSFSAKASRCGKNCSAGDFGSDSPNRDFRSFDRFLSSGLGRPNCRSFRGCVVPMVHGGCRQTGRIFQFEIVIRIRCVARSVVFGSPSVGDGRTSGSGFRLFSLLPFGGLASFGGLWDW